MKSIEELIESASYDMFNPTLNFEIAKKYDELGQNAAAISFYLRAAEYGYENYPLITYTSLIKISFCLENQTGREHTVSSTLLQAIEYMPSRPEAYFLLSRFYERTQKWQECYTFAEIGSIYGSRVDSLPAEVEYPGAYGFTFEKAVSAWWLGRQEESSKLFNNLLKEDIGQNYRSTAEYNIKLMDVKVENKFNTLEPFVTNYRKFFGSTADTIVDIGTRDGNDASYLAEALNAKNIIAFDANPDCVEKVKSHYPKINFYHTAVSNYDGLTSFQVVRSDDESMNGCSSIYAEKVANEPQFQGLVSLIKVPVIRMDTFIKNNQIDYALDVVKIDVEGFSWEVLESFGEYLKTIKILHVETDRKKTQPNNKTPEEIAYFMEENGFFLADVSYEWGWGIEDQVWVNKELAVFNKQCFDK